MLSNRTGDFNNNSKDKTKTKNKQISVNLDYLILPLRTDRESSPKNKSNHKLIKEIKKECVRMS